jgi:signal peptidase
MIKLNKPKKPAIIYVLNIGTKLIIVLLLLIIIVSAIFYIKESKNPNELPSIFGFKAGVIETGSMKPLFPIGTMVIIKEVSQDNLRENDIITFNDDKMLVTHRIIEIQQQNGKTSYLTKGDANNKEDTKPVNYEEIEGKIIFHMSEIGKAIETAKSPLRNICNRNNVYSNNYTSTVI